jgi:hypothetical protein
VSGERRDLPAVVETPATTLSSSLVVPAIIANAGDRAARRFLGFFAASFPTYDTLFQQFSKYVLKRCKQL